jgi:hypothetical protein
MRLTRDGCIVRRAVEHRDHTPTTAVRQLDDGASVAAGGVDRHQDREIRLKPDEAIGVSPGRAPDR